jgi:hypothetical protein
MIILIYRASGIEINKHDFIFITKRALNEFE